MVEPRHIGSSIEAQWLLYRGAWLVASGRSGCRVEALAGWRVEACWLSCRKLMAYWSGLARKGLLRLKRPHQERGWKREDGTSSPTHYYRRPGALCEADQYLDGSRSFHPCDHGKRNLAQASVTTTRISLSSRQPRLQCKAATISKSQPQQPF